MNFDMIILSQNIKTMQNCVIWIPTALLFILKLKNFIKILQMMLKTDMIHQIIQLIDRPLPKEMNKNVIGLMTDELGGKITTEFVALRPKTYCYLTDDDKNVKKAKGTKKCVIRRILMFDDYKGCLFKNEIILKLQQRFKCEAHNVYTEEIDKIALSSSDDKRLQTFDKITTYPYRTNAFKVCESEMLSKYK